MMCVCCRVGSVCFHEVRWYVREGSVRARGCVVSMFVSVLGKGCVSKGNVMVSRILAKL